MGTSSSTLRAEEENALPPPDYEPDNDRVTIAFHFGGKIHEGVYSEQDGSAKIYKYDHVPVSLLSVEEMRLFVARHNLEGDFNLYLKDRSGLSSLTEDVQLFHACDKLENIRECIVCVVLKSAINGDVCEVADDGTDGDDSLEGLSDFSDSDEEYEYNMGESEDSDDEILENVFDRAPESSNRTSARNNKDKEKVIQRALVLSSAAEVNELESEDDDFLNDSDEDLTTARDSDDEASNRLNCPTFNPLNKFDPKLCLGMIFSSKKVLKTAIQSMAINDKRNVKFPKNDKTRLWAECDVPTCPWMIRGLRMKNESTFQVTTYFEKHTCKPTFNVKNVTSTWLAEKFKDRFKNDPKRDLEAFRIESIGELEVHISQHQVLKTKNKALELIEGKPDTQYEFLYSYVEEVKRSNPGSTVELVVDGSDGRRIFDRLYVCINAANVGFKDGCRPVLCFDGCWLKGVSGGCLLTACGVDANNNYLPIAWAVVGKECTDSWAWFMRILKGDLGILDTKYYTLMSDKQKGLIQAELDEFPGAEYRYCARHLLVNFQNAGFRGMTLKKLFWKAARTTTPNAFETVMDEMQKVEPGAEQWLRQRPPSQWSRAFFRDFARCDILTNNACETFNGNIRKSRERPIITMLEEIHEALMKRFAKNRDKAAKAKRWQEVLCPRIQGFIDKHNNRLQEFIPLKADNHNFSIKGIYGSQYHVDLKAGTCACRKWQLSGFPCIHTQCALNFLQHDVEPFTHKCYQVATYKMTYKHCVFPINSKEEWPKTNMLPISPPFYERRKSGRPVVKRRLEQGEQQAGGQKRKPKPKPLIVIGAKGHKQLRRQDAVFRCTRCGNGGHNTRTCKNDPILPMEPYQPAKVEEEIIDLTVGIYPMATQEIQATRGCSNEVIKPNKDHAIDEANTNESDWVATLLQDMIESAPPMDTDTSPNVGVIVPASDPLVIIKDGKTYMTLKNIIEEASKGKGD